MTRQRLKSQRSWKKNPHGVCGEGLRGKEQYVDFCIVQCLLCFRRSVDDSSAVQRL